ncbi:elongation of very long chain fatty acids protein F-like [Drosophila albomicans]|uniref:Elongation of very long chain fatty acids protein n=1 Tax=Drosophila albomicans TaxID=7291 RepID=A0A6P8YF50_DROAB|nr:elongation of very long chain fatty acids protein F-like [Drosophila albomicans]
MLSRVLEVFFLPAADPVAAKLPFLDSAWPTTILLFSYLAFVLKWGKIFMEDRRPFNLTKILIWYNIFQVIYNFLMFSAGVYVFLIKPIYDLRCMPTIALDHPNKNTERVLGYIYFINKIIDLLDTIFFVLRKSYKQITVLHVFHHVLMVFVIYWVVRFYGVGGQFMVMGLLNTFVHTVMYFYYMVSAKYSGLKGSIWWKKYITLIQIIQFIIVLSQSVYIYFFNSQCKFPTSLQFLISSCASLFIVMFTSFYIKTYTTSRPQKQH